MLKQQNSWLIIFILAGIHLLSLTSLAQENIYLQLETPELVLQNVEFEITLTPYEAGSYTLVDHINENDKDLNIHTWEVEEDEIEEPITLTLTATDSGYHTLQVFHDAEVVSLEKDIKCIPGWVSLLPALLAIALALLFNEVLLALFAGVWAGASIIHGSLTIGLLRTLDTNLPVTLGEDMSHVYVLFFTVGLGALIALIQKSGAMGSLVNLLREKITTRTQCEQATWGLGLLIFFDDYANSLLVGNTMRPLSDRFRISREKLAYLVDSTAAPIASIALVSTWIGFELGLIEEVLGTLPGLEDVKVYSAFIESISYRFYSILTIAFVFFIAWTGKDFGPMLEAEKRAVLENKVLADGSEPMADDKMLEKSVLSRHNNIPLINAFAPILMVIALTLFGLLYTGLQSLDPQAQAAVWEEGFIRGLGTLFGNGNSFTSLLWATYITLGLTIAAYLTQGILSIKKSMESVIVGFQSMVMVCTTLILAWGIGSVCDQLHTADYLINLASGNLMPQLIPTLIFILAGIIAFSTGSSWGTMTVAVPLALPLAYKLSQQAGLDPELTHSILIGTLASVLAGATFGDHCSPISDTTIMSSAACGANHIDHVKTQAPYALVTAAASILLGSIPAGFGINPWLCNLVGIIALYFFIVQVGTDESEFITFTPNPFEDEDEEDEENNEPPSNKPSAQGAQDY